MAYMTVRLTAGSYDPATNSTSVSATVYMTWDTSQSYDQTNSVGTLTIGDYSTTFSANYNASKTSSGTQVLGGGTTTIKHNSTGDAVQVVADATTPRYSASDIITLPGGTPSGSSGGNTGGSSGGDSGGGSTTYSCRVNILQYQHAHAIVKREDTQELLTKGSFVPQYTRIIVEVYADAGYEITTLTQNCINLDISNGSASFSIQKDTTIAIGAAPVEGSYRHPVKANNCALVGQLQGYYSHGYSANEWYKPSDKDREYISVGYDGGYGNYYVAMFTIATPALDGISDVMHFEVDYTGSFYTGSSTTIMYALCESDANKNYYKTATAAVYDEKQIGVGSTVAFNSDVVDYQATHHILSIDIPTTGLQPDTTYYLLLWRNGSDAINLYNKQELTLYCNVRFVATVNRPIQGVVPIADGASSHPYRICIANGTDFDHYAAYVDNGTGWDLYS